MTVKWTAPDYLEASAEVPVIRETSCHACDTVCVWRTVTHWHEAITCPICGTSIDVAEAPTLAEEILLARHHVEATTAAKLPTPAERIQDLRRLLHGGPPPDHTDHGRTDT